MTSGPLCGTRVLEFAAIGPGPHCAMLLSDLGARVLRIERPDGPGPGPGQMLTRGRASLVLNLKDPDDVQCCLRIVERADVLIEGFRPGVMERLGLGPEECLTVNPRLIYGRMTGWGQEGPLAHAAGHDINYIALTGALAGMRGCEGPPNPPLNLVGDFGGGSLYLALGIVAALYERERSGKGQVVDAAIVDGVASLMAFFSGPNQNGRDLNFLDGSAHYYRCYRCSDGRDIAVGAIEPKFYAILMEKLGVGRQDAPPQEAGSWQQSTDWLARIFATRTRDEWCTLFDGTDACVSPVLELDESAVHAHLRGRHTFVTQDGVLQPAPAPRFSRTPGSIQGPPPTRGEGGESLLSEWGVSLRRD